MTTIEIKTSAEIRTAIASLRDLGFTDCETYLAWRRLWKETYRDLTAAIRFHKANRKETVSGLEESWRHASIARNYREVARGMLEEILANGRAKAQEQYRKAHEAQAA